MGYRKNDMMKDDWLGRIGHCGNICEALYY
jgi:hypothetical protein